VHFSQNFLYGIYIFIITLLSVFVINNKETKRYFINGIFDY